LKRRLILFLIFDKDITLTSQTPDINEYVYGLRNSDLKNIYKKYYFGLDVAAEASGIQGKLYYNSLAFHSSASLLNVFDNLLFQSVANSKLKSIKTTNDPISADNSISSRSGRDLEILACIDSMPLSVLNFVNALIIAFIIR
jgi:hypothetical protein